MFNIYFFCLKITHFWETFVSVHKSIRIVSPTNLCRFLHGLRSRPLIEEDGGDNRIVKFGDLVHRRRQLGEPLRRAKRISNNLIAQIHRRHICGKVGKGK